MYAIIKDEQLIWFTDYKPTQKNMLFDEVIKGDFDLNKNYKYENGVIVDITPIPAEKTPEEIKSEKINLFKEIKKEAVQKRSEYLTAELLSEWVFKTMSLAKLEEDRVNIEARYNECMNSLISEYWEEILKELL